MRTLVVGTAGVIGTVAVAGFLAAMDAAGSIPVALLALWAIAGAVGTRAASADAASVEAWRRERRARREGGDR